METADFNKLLFAVDNVPEFGGGGAENDVAGVVEAGGVEGGIGGRVVEVAGDDGGAADAEFARVVVACDVVARVVDESGDMVSIWMNTGVGVTYFTSMFGSGTPTLPVSSWFGQG